MLFLIYINDLPFSIKHADVTMYADDTRMTYASKDLNEVKYKINEDLSNIESWLMGNKLALNVAKTQSMIIGSNNLLDKVDTTTGFEISNESIEQVPSKKYLGVRIDDKLKWKSQVDALATKISRAIGLIKYAKRSLPLKTIQGLYRSLVEPHFRYCCSVWGCVNKTNLDRLQKLQNRAIRTISNARYDAPVQPLLMRLGLLSVPSLIKEESAKIVFKSPNNLAPDYMKGLFVKNSQNYTRVLRNTHGDLRTPFLQTNGSQNCFAYRGAKIWNSLDTELKQISTLGSFNRKLKMKLLASQV